MGCREYDVQQLKGRKRQNPKLRELGEEWVSLNHDDDTR